MTDDAFSHAQRVAQRFPRGSVERWVALYHDHLEDDLGDVPADILRHVLLLTRSDGEPYADYITRIGSSGNNVAIDVKLADLADNIERCQGRHGGTVKPQLESRYRTAVTTLTAWRNRGDIPQPVVSQNSNQTEHCCHRLHHLQTAITSILDAEIGDDVPALRQLLLTALQETGGHP